MSAHELTAMRAVRAEIAPGGILGLGAPAPQAEPPPSAVRCITVNTGPGPVTSVGLGRILVVDDEPRMCESLRQLLGREGYQVTSATSSKEARVLLSQASFDLMLVDLVLPDGKGESLTEEVMRRYPGLPLVVITAHASVESAIWALRQGAHDYVRKPFEFEELARRVANALERKRLLQEKEQISAKLALSEQRYRCLLQNSPDLIYTLDEQGRFTFVSDALQRLAGFAPSALLGRPFTTLFHEKDRDRASEHLQTRGRTPHAHAAVELRLNTALTAAEDAGPDSRVLTVEVKAGGLHDGEGHFLGSLGVARDITDRKRLEAQLQQARRMEAIGTLAGGIAHDFNNLLTGIQGYTSLMLLETEPVHPNHQKLRHIEEYIQSAVELTRQLLGFARGGKYDVKPIDLNSLIVKSSEMFGRTKKEVVIRRRLAENLWTANGDASQIEQVLLNLYVNAWQAMPAGGELSLETENVQLDERTAGSRGLAPGRYVRIRVADTGVGIDEKTLPRIFEPFFTTKKMGRGTGLGLASAYGIVQNHHGMIEVRSERGQGTTFTLLIPASNRPVECAPHEETRVLTGPETILLVDDEEMILRVGSELLKALGYRVLTARGGKEAVDLVLARRGEVALVLLDMIMPGMSGTEAFDALKHAQPGIRVLLSSGYSLDTAAAEILKRGGDGFIQKPFSLRALSQKLREVISSPSPQPQALPQAE